MLLVAAIAVAIVAILGLACLFLLRAGIKRQIIDDDRQISWLEYVAVMALAVLVITPTVLILGEKLSVDEKLRYEEMRNGVEVSATVSNIECRAGHAGESYSAGRSNCAHTFVSGSYSWEETYTDTECTSNSKGETSCRSVTKCCHSYSANIYTPYATTEQRYQLADSLGGSYDYPTIYIPPDAKQYADRLIPVDVPRGAPDDWLEAHRRLDAGDPRPVTRMFDYDNYILASGDELLKAYSADVQTYLDKKLLPDHTAGILDNPLYGDSRMQAKKARFVGVYVPNEDEWQDALMRFNAALGSQLQGDLHIVVIDSKLVDSPQRYAKALRAYWLGDHFGKRALSKNGVILVVGASEGKIDWAQADTGMPFGNNTMLRTMEGLLVGMSLDTNAVFGNPRTVMKPAQEGSNSKVNVTLSVPAGALETAMFGESTRFRRPCMKCEGAEDMGGVGYKNLIAQIEPSARQKSWMVAIITVLAIPLWLTAAFTSFCESASRRPVRVRRYYY